MTPSFRWLAIAFAVLIAGACVRRADAGRSVPPSEGQAAPAGGPSARGSQQAGPAPRPRGGAAPAAAGTEEVGPRMVGVDELRREMTAARGRSLFVHLWATWCGPCLQELPAVDQFARAARARGAVVLSLSLDTEWRGIARVNTVLRERAPSLTPAVARFENAEQFITLLSPSWEGTIPALFAFDRAGKLESNLIGEVEPAAFQALLARIEPPSGRSQATPATPTAPAAARPSSPGARAPSPSR